MQLLLATRNKHKLKELAALLRDLHLEVISAGDLPNLPGVVEDGATIRDNAVKKAVQTARMAKKLTLADDTCLEVDALKGEPGVRSARFAGEEATYHENNKKLLRMLEGVAYDKRSARFRCVVAIADENGLYDCVEGICNGTIIEAERGGGGFGYDPLFLADGQTKTFAEISPEVKNRISHRAKAMQKTWAVLSRYLREKGGSGESSAPPPRRERK
jgi:XTP/dITP diphosphohydrolase